MDCELKAPLSVNFELTQGCNNACVHCYNGDRNFKLGNNEEKLRAFHFLEMIDILGDEEIFSITFTGGEPLLGKDTLFLCIERALSHSIDVSVNSNLVALNERDADKFSSYEYFNVLTSLLSHSPRTHDKITGVNGSHKRTLKGIKLLREKGVHVSINIVLSKDNLSEFPETMNFLINEYGIDRVFGTKIVPSPRVSLQNSINLTHEETIWSMDQMLKVQEKYGILVGTLDHYPFCIAGNKFEKYRTLLFKYCGAGKNKMSTTPHGDIAVCAHFPGDYGNILKDSLKDIWKKMEDWRKGLFVPDECKPCSAVEICGGGCRVNSLCANGNIGGKDPMMTGPIQIKLEDVGSVDKNTKYVMTAADNLQFRKESFGYVIRLRSKNRTIFLGEDDFIFFKILSKLKRFSANEVKNYGYPEYEIGRFLSFLHKKLIIKEEEN